jgi:hypothetical protein
VKRRTLPAWLAILAIALQAAWPLVSQAKPREAGHLVPLCSIDGVTHYVEIPAGKPPVEQRSAIFHEHCKLCVFGVERVASVPPSAQPLHVPLAPLQVRAREPVLPYSYDVDLPADARAPPTYS